MADIIVDLDPFNPSSVARANQILQREIKSFNKKVDTFLKKLAEIGRQAAEDAYGTGGAVKVTVEPAENGYEIRADGTAVAFLEFGAGRTVNTGNRYAPVMPFKVDEGSWSEEHARMYVTLHYWEFGGKRYEAVEPRNGMERAYESIIQSIRTVTQEVFNA